MPVDLMEEKVEGLQKVNRSDLSWAAGLFEGEGSVRINKPTKRNLGNLVVAITNTDIEVLNFFQERWPGYLRPVSGMRPDQRKAWVWVLASRKAAYFIGQVYPFIKTNRVKTKMDLGIAFQNQKKIFNKHTSSEKYRQHQWDIFNQMKELNVRGVRKGQEANKTHGST